MREASPRQDRATSRAMAIAVVWMLLIQVGCVLLWDADWLTRQSALVHWLVVGVMPPALALAQLRPDPPIR